MAVNKPKMKKQAMSKNTIFALSGVAIIVVLILFFTIERSLFRMITKNNTIISKKQTAEKTVKANLALMPELERQFNSISNLHGKINNSLPEDTDYPGIVAAMEVMAGTSSMILNSVTPTSSTATIATAPTTQGTSSSPSAAVATINNTATPTATNNAPAQPIPIEVTVQVTGTYNNFLQFLNKLQLSSRPMQIQSIRLGGVSDAIDANVKMTTYYFKPDVLKEKTEAVQ